MTKTEDLRAHVCETYGVADRELVDVIESPAGLTWETTDGVWMIHVPGDTPDFEGKTGVMLLTAPILDEGRTYQGDCPIFANGPAEGDDQVDDDAPKLTKAQQKAADKAAADAGKEAAAS